MSKKEKQYTYLFDIVRDLAAFEQPGRPKFLKTNISYNKRSMKRISKLQSKFGPLTEVDLYGETEKTKAMLEINDLRKDARNRIYRFNLNLLGFFQYLKWANDNGKTNVKKIDTIVRNLSTGEDLSFLKYLDAFDLEYKKEFLIEVSLALQSQLNEASVEYLRHYLVLRCYEEISFWPAFQDGNIFRHLYTEKENKFDSDLRNMKIKILDTLIPLERERMRFMEDDLKITQESLLRPLT